MKNVKVTPFVKTCHYNADSLNELITRLPSLGSTIKPSLYSFGLTCIDVQGTRRTVWQWLTSQSKRWTVKLKFESIEEPTA